MLQRLRVLIPTLRRAGDAEFLGELRTITGSNAIFALELFLDDLDFWILSFFVSSSLLLIFDDFLS